MCASARVCCVRMCDASVRVLGRKNDVFPLTDLQALQSVHGTAPYTGVRSQLSHTTEFRSCVKVEVASWAPRPNEPYGFCGRKATLNHA